MTKAWRPLSSEERELLDEQGRRNEEEVRRMAQRAGVPEILVQHFDRDGEPMSYADYYEARRDPDYKVVACDAVGIWEVSTIWLGHNLRHDAEGPPLIFETLVFKIENSERTGVDPYEKRFATEEEALKGHREAVAAAEAGLDMHSEWAGPA